MPVRRSIALAIVVCTFCSLAHGDGLAGLWTAKGRFGPDLRGTLIVSTDGGGFRGEIAGRSAPMRTEADEVVFELPDRLGFFRGKREGSRIAGHWFRYGTPVNGADAGDAPVSLSPVVLEADGAGRWRGVVAPLQDDFTFFLRLTPRPDGRFGAVLRNPEFDLGTQQGVDTLVVDGSRLKLLGTRRGQVNEVGAGQIDADGDIITLTFPTRGGSYDFRRDGDASDFYPRGHTPGRYVYRRPPPLDDGWRVSTLAAEDFDVPALERFVQMLLDMPMESNDALQIHAVLIARHGRLVFEEYFHGEHRDKPHMTRSAAKSMTAVLAGAVMQSGAPLKLSSPVYEVMNGGRFPADLDPRKRGMTLEHLLTMSSGYFCDDGNDAAPGNEETMWDQREEPDFWRYTLNVPLATPPGERAIYCSANPNLALGMVARATGEMPVYSFDRLVARPMKLGNYAWLLDHAGNPYGGGGVMFLPRDFLKFGQLMLNGGTWEGRRILSRQFVAAASTPQYHLAGIYYGYNWWMEDFPYRERAVRAVMALGAGGQVITVVPELDLVVAFYAGNYSSRVQRELGHSYVPNFILPAVRMKGEDAAAPVIDGAYASPYGRGPDGSRVAR
ncbi:MAG TPA: serine hydrolase [Steroidobacteraceae bacterium]|nr:serine hydrolase [Steroidobacteraceae bacterium]